MTNWAEEHPGEKMPVHIDHAATVSTRMPTPEECAAGYPAGAPVLVVADGSLNDKVFPHQVALTFDDPHAQPEPDKARAAAAYVLATVSEELANIRGRVTDLGAAFGGAPCQVTELADEVRGERDAAWHCADASVCGAGRPAVSAT